MSVAVILRQMEQRQQEPLAVASLDLTFVLDNSGSMYPHVRAVSSAYDRLLDEQRRLAGDGLALTLAIFDEDCAVGPTEELHKAQSLIAHGYNPALGGGTALNDAIVKTVRETAVRLATKPAAVVVVIVTDGHENSSVHSTADAFTAVASGHLKGWKFIFVGANQNAQATAAKYGIPPENALTFAQRQIGFSRAFRALSENLLAYRRNAGALGFTESQRREQRLLLSERNP